MEFKVGDCEVYRNTVEKRSVPIHRLLQRKLSDNESSGLSFFVMSCILVYIFHFNSLGQ